LERVQRLGTGGWNVLPGLRALFSIWEVNFGPMVSSINIIYTKILYSLIYLIILQS
jgi:hypothetical protein